MLSKKIVFFGQTALLSCDGKCEKAWGINNRPYILLSEDPDDIVWLSDTELDLAPEDPGTYEGGGHAKPRNKKQNKWCARECERSETTRPNEPVLLKDWGKRVKNK